MSDPPAIYDHVRTTDDAPVQSGVYRVVGVGEEVTLLRVADASGRRQNTGEVVTVAAETVAEFETADNPDIGFSPGSLLAPLSAYAVAIPYWFRRLVDRLRPS